MRFIGISWDASMSFLWNFSHTANHIPWGRIKSTESLREEETCESERARRERNREGERERAIAKDRKKRESRRRQRKKRWRERKREREGEKERKKREREINWKSILNIFCVKKSDLVGYQRSRHV